MKVSFLCLFSILSESFFSLFIFYVCLFSIFVCFLCLFIFDLCLFSIFVCFRSKVKAPFLWCKHWMSWGSLKTSVVDQRRVCSAEENRLQICSKNKQKQTKENRSTEQLQSQNKHIMTESVRYYDVLDNLKNTGNVLQFKFHIVKTFHWKYVGQIIGKKNEGYWTYGKLLGQRFLNWGVATVFRVAKYFLRVAKVY